MKIRTHSAHTLYFCYIDESGTSAIPGNSSHFVLVGLSIPVYKWKNAESDIDAIKKKYKLSGKEIHTGWLLRNYDEQDKILNFETLNLSDRIAEVEKYRLTKLFILQKDSKLQKQYQQTKKNYEHTKHYTHLTFQERKDFILEVSKMIGSWQYARVFAECIDKTFFFSKTSTIDEQAFEQIVTRFENFLTKKGNTSTEKNIKNYGILIHDNNPTVAKRHTEMMKQFHQKGTSFTKVDNIIETPLFVDSSLTSMIQLADVCAYGIRRYIEYQEEAIFSEIYKRGDTKGTAKVGVRHFTAVTCKCIICENHSLHTVKELKIIP